MSASVSADVRNRDGVVGQKPPRDRLAMHCDRGRDEHFVADEHVAGVLAAAGESSTRRWAMRGSVAKAFDDQLREARRRPTTREVSISIQVLAWWIAMKPAEHR